MKLAVVTAIPTPYRDPFWNVVAAHPEVQSLDVYYCAAGKPDRPWDVDWDHTFKAHLLSSINLLKWAGADASAYWVRGLQGELKRAKHDTVIVGGYNHPSMLQSIRGCVKRGQPYFLMCETYQRRCNWKSAIKDSVLKWVCRRAAGGLPTGIRAAEYLQSYGIPFEKMLSLPNVPDVRGLIRQGQEFRRNIHESRRLLNLPTAGSVLTFVGRMIPKKRPELTIRAFADGAPDDATLVMLGDGPLLAECKSLSEQLGLADRVRFPGFVQPKEVPRYLAVADAFVLPSSETWGVAAVEAISLGVPVILSDEVGCHPDLVRNRKCGVVVPAGCQSSLATAIHELLSDPIAPQLVRESTEFLTAEFAYDILAEKLVERLCKATDVEPGIGSCQEKRPMTL